MLKKFEKLKLWAFGHFKVSCTALLHTMVTQPPPVQVKLPRAQPIGYIYYTVTFPQKTKENRIWCHFNWVFLRVVCFIIVNQSFKVLEVLNTHGILNRYFSWL